MNIVTITATATLPTTFMKLAKLNTVTIAQHRRSAAAHGRSVAGARRLELDRLEVGARSATRRARSSTRSTRTATASSLITFSDGARVLDPMPSSRGFNKTKLMADIPNTLPGGSTAMVEGLYRGWDEVRAVPRGQQSGLRVIVLFTDGASNSVPGIYPGSTGRRAACEPGTFPDNGADPDNQTHLNPQINGLYDTETGAASGGSGTAYLWSCSRGKTLTRS